MPAYPCGVCVCVCIRIAPAAKLCGRVQCSARITHSTPASIEPWEPLDMPCCWSTACMHAPSMVLCSLLLEYCMHACSVHGFVLLAAGVSHAGMMRAGAHAPVVLTAAACARECQHTTCARVSVRICTHPRSPTRKPAHIHTSRVCVRVRVSCPQPHHATREVFLTSCEHWEPLECIFGWAVVCRPKVGCSSTAVSGAVVCADGPQEHGVGTSWAGPCSAVSRRGCSVSTGCCVRKRAPDA